MLLAVAVARFRRQMRALVNGGDGRAGAGDCSSTVGPVPTRAMRYF